MHSVGRQQLKAHRRSVPFSLLHPQPCCHSEQSSSQQATSKPCRKPHSSREGCGSSIPLSVSVQTTEKYSAGCFSGRQDLSLLGGSEPRSNASSPGLLVLSDLPAHSHGHQACLNFPGKEKMEAGAERGKKSCPGGRVPGQLWSCFVWEFHGWSRSMEHCLP